MCDTRTIGQVKWFNNKAGYGFITKDDKDIFVHFSAIQTSDSQYKYLVQGEYVEFEIVPTTEGPHEVQAVNISGINKGKLMCETRLQSKKVPGKEDAKETDGEFTKVERKKRSTKAPTKDKKSVESK